VQSGYAALHFAAVRGRPLLVRQLVELGASLQQRRRVRCSRRRCVDARHRRDRAVCARVTHVRGVPQDGETPLYDAASGGDVDTLHELLRLRASIDERTRVSALPRSSSALHRCLGKLRALLITRRGARQSGATPLHVATFMRRGEMVAELVRMGADVNEKSSVRWVASVPAPARAQLGPAVG
jgi:ankyrin repeat protein